MTDWYVKGLELANCNCSYGCPCQFNALPTHGHCSAVGGFQIDQGRYGDVPLDGIRMVGIYSWPGPVHEGNGTMQLIIEERATPAQREALQRIATGQDTREMATMWWVYGAMCPKKLPTLFKPIELEIDVDGRRGRILVPGLVETAAEPIRNPVTGAEHRARIDLPHGFEYEIAEIGSGRSRTTGDIQLEYAQTYTQFARLHLNQDGIVRQATRVRESERAVA